MSKNLIEDYDQIAAYVTAIMKDYAKFLHEKYGENEEDVIKRIREASNEEYNKIKTTKSWNSFC